MCALLCCMSVLILTCRSRLLLSFCAALILCLALVSAPQSYSQWDSTDMPLCEAYRRRDSWASPGSSCSSTQGDREDVEGPPSQETNPQHHLNGHGTSSIEKAWGENGTLSGTLLDFRCTRWTRVWLDRSLLCVMDWSFGMMDSFVHKQENKVWQYQM